MFVDKALQNRNLLNTTMEEKSENIFDCLIVNSTEWSKYKNKKKKTESELRCNGFEYFGRIDGYLIQQKKPHHLGLVFFCQSHPSH